MGYLNGTAGDYLSTFIVWRSLSIRGWSCTFSGYFILIYQAETGLLNDIEILFINYFEGSQMIPNNWDLYKKAHINGSSENRLNIPWTPYFMDMMNK